MRRSRNKTKLYRGGRGGHAEKRSPLRQRDGEKDSPCGSGRVRQSQSTSLPRCLIGEPSLESAAAALRPPRILRALRGEAFSFPVDNGDKNKVGTSARFDKMRLPML